MTDAMKSPGRCRRGPATDDQANSERSPYPSPRCSAAVLRTAAVSSPSYKAIRPSPAIDWSHCEDSDRGSRHLVPHASRRGHARVEHLAEWQHDQVRGTNRFGEVVVAQPFVSPGDPAPGDQPEQFGRYTSSAHRPWTRKCASSSSSAWKPATRRSSPLYRSTRPTKPNVKCWPAGAVARRRRCAAERRKPVRDDHSRAVTTPMPGMTISECVAGLRCTYRHQLGQAPVQDRGERCGVLAVRSQIVHRPDDLGPTQARDPEDADEHREAEPPRSRSIGPSTGHPANGCAGRQTARSGRRGSRSPALAHRWPRRGSHLARQRIVIRSQVGPARPGR